eukprot:COSAG02_NODE_2452_length_8826_cov_16.362668_9_plen_187_part_00
MDAGTLSSDDAITQLLAMDASTLKNSFPGFVGVAEAPVRKLADTLIVSVNNLPQVLCSNYCPHCCQTSLRGAAASTAPLTSSTAAAAPEDGEGRWILIAVVLLICCAISAIWRARKGPRQPAESTASGAGYCDDTAALPVECSLLAHRLAMLVGHVHAPLLKSNAALAEQWEARMRRLSIRWTVRE